MTALSLNRRTLAPLHCASDDSTRYALNSLHIEPDGTTVATNGHLMAVCKPSQPLEGDDTLTAFELAADDLKEINKQQRKKVAPEAIVDTEATNQNGHCRVTSNGRAYELPKNDPGFPDWRKIEALSDTEVYHSVTISLATLEQMIASARQFSQTRKGDGCAMRFDFPENTDGKGGWDPFRVTHIDKDSGDTLEVTIMPMRS